MKRAMKLKGRIHLQQDNSLRFESTVYDGQAFSLNVTQFDVQLGGAFKPSKRYVDGFLFCDCEAQQGDVCYLTLPKPTLNFGKQITVKEHLLQPRSAGIEDFKPTKRTPAALGAPIKNALPKVATEDIEDTIGDLCDDE